MRGSLLIDDPLPIDTPCINTHRSECLRVPAAPAEHLDGEWPKAGCDHVTVLSQVPLVFACGCLALDCVNIIIVTGHRAPSVSTNLPSKAAPSTIMSASCAVPSCGSFLWMFLLVVGFFSLSRERASTGSEAERFHTLFQTAP